MRRQRLVIGNWKANPESLASTKKLFAKVKRSLPTRLGKTEVVVAPPSPYLGTLKGSKRLLLGAQDVSTAHGGAHTGEASADMLKSLGVSHVIIGHSERRAEGESDEDVAKKMKAALLSRITPVLCVGELTRDDSGEHLGFVKNQLSSALSKVEKASIGKIVVAYEPVWAISTHSKGIAMSPADVHEMILYIQKLLTESYGKAIAAKVLVLYGGSVNEENVDAIMATGAVDGFLVGSASLDPQNFKHIIKSTLR